MNKVALIVNNLIDKSYCFGYIDEAQESICIKNNNVLYKVHSDSNWLGFYDWLRTKSGDVIGLRIKIDDISKRLESKLIKLFFSSSDIEGNINYIYFGDCKDFVEDSSGDADFCDFSIYYSSQSIGITFNRPR